MLCDDARRESACAREVQIREVAPASVDPRPTMAPGGIGPVWEDSTYEILATAADGVRVAAIRCQTALEASERDAALMRYRRRLTAAIVELRRGLRRADRVIEEVPR